MAKIKLVHFELVSLLDESKKLVEFLQKSGVMELENTCDENLTKYQTDYIVSQYIKKQKKAVEAYGILEKHCELKKPFIESFSDVSDIDYNEYKLISDRSDKLLDICNEIVSLENKLKSLNGQIAENQALMQYYEPWLTLDIPMASKRTLTTSIFIGCFPQSYNKEEVLSLINEADGSPEDVEVEIVSQRKMLTCAVIMCHQSSSEKLLEILKNNGFVIPDKIAPKLPSKAVEELKEDVFNQSLGDAGIYCIAGAHYIGQSHLMLDNNKCAHFLFRHIHACHHNGHHIVMLYCAFLTSSGEEAHQGIGVIVRT